MYYNKREARALLPRVGDTLELVPTLAKVQGMPAPPPWPCKVVAVNEAHLWYRVEFANGTTECYKVPPHQLGPRGGIHDHDKKRA